MWIVLLLATTYAFRVTKRICEELGMYENGYEKTMEEKPQIICHVSAMIGLPMWFMFLALKHEGAGWLIFAITVLFVFTTIYKECEEIERFIENMGKLHIDFFHPPSSETIYERLKEREDTTVRPD